MYVCVWKIWYAKRQRERETECVSDCVRARSVKVESREGRERSDGVRCTHVGRRSETVRVRVCVCVWRRDWAG